MYDIHGHYADAGEAAALMSYTLGVDMVLTGHSLGRNKLDHLLKSGEMGLRGVEGVRGNAGRQAAGRSWLLGVAQIVPMEMPCRTRVQPGFECSSIIALAALQLMPVRMFSHDIAIGTVSAPITPCMMGMSL